MTADRDEPGRAETLAELCLRNMLDASRPHIYFKDLQSRFLHVSRSQAEFLSSDEEGVVGKSDFDFYTAEFAQTTYDAEQDIMRSGKASGDLLERETWDDQRLKWVVTNKFPLRAITGEVIGTFGVSRDVTEEQHTRQQLDTVLANSPDAIMRLDPTLTYTYANPAAEQMIGRSAPDIIGLTDEALGRGTDFLEIWKPALRRALENGESVQVEHHAGEGKAERYFDSSVVVELDGDTIAGLLVMTRDITDRKRAELTLAIQAVRDPLTGLANRTLLLDRIDQSLLRLERSPATLAILFLDLDRFKVINDSLGHNFGDAVLIEVAERLRSFARRSDTVARFGGDEFVMLCDRISAEQDAIVIAERLGRELAVPFVHGGQDIHITASIGITTTTDPHAVAGDLIRDADTAMYQAKERGRGTGRFQFFDADVRERAVSRMTIETELRKALERNEFRLHYQPLQELSSGKLHGVEALIRWQHPTRGLLTPIDFIPVAEESNVIVAIGAWVLDEACRQLAVWNQDRPAAAHLTMAVNISARQLGSHVLVQTVADALARHSIQPRTLCLEITETALLEEAIASPEIFSSLHNLGVLIALDDFGTGYSSLAHLRRFPVDILKIDREFVSGTGNAAGDKAIVLAVTAVARALGMATVGEGVETLEQLEELRASGCDDAQGYFLGRPMAADDMTSVLMAATV